MTKWNHSGATPHGVHRSVVSGFYPSPNVVDDLSGHNFVSGKPTNVMTFKSPLKFRAPLALEVIASAFTSDRIDQPWHVGLVANICLRLFPVPHHFSINNKAQVWPGLIYLVHRNLYPIVQSSIDVH